MLDVPEFPRIPFRTTADALAAAGITPRQLRSGRADGAVRQLLRGVAVAADVPDSLDVRIRAVALVVNPDHVVCDRMAAWIHGVDVLLIEEHELLPPVEVCALRGRQPSERHGVRGKVRDLAPADIMEIGGLRVTTPLRTALDLGCNLRRRDAFAALVDFARRHGIGRDELLVGLKRFRRRRGVVQLRQLIPLVDPVIESPREAWTFLELHDAALPLPTPQFWVLIGGVPTYRLDFAYPSHRVAIEYDGMEWHDKTDEQRQSDEERRTWLRDHGWTVIVVRVGDFTGGRLDRWIEQVRQALSARYSNQRF